MFMAMSTANGIEQFTRCGWCAGAMYGIFGAVSQTRPLPVAATRRAVIQITARAPGSLGMLGCLLDLVDHLLCGCSHRALGVETKGFLVLLERALRVALGQVNVAQQNVRSR